MQFERTAIADVVLITPEVFADARGLFFETWEERKFLAAGFGARFVQDNHSRSVKNTLRGLHYQIARSQGKLVRVVRGTIFDVAVDLRKRSATFGKWVGLELSETNHQMLWIPPGFAHGFLVLSDCADVVYRCTDFWERSHERTILWNDTDLNVRWPLPGSTEPLLSAKDRCAGGLAEAECFP
jgi:dTDP-4-dehydrorhamnose 3,5-epimerase